MIAKVFGCIAGAFGGLMAFVFANYCLVDMMHINTTSGMFWPVIEALFSLAVTGATGGIVYEHFAPAERWYDATEKKVEDLVRQTRRNKRRLHKTRSAH